MRRANCQWSMLSFNSASAAAQRLTVSGATPQNGWGETWRGGTLNILTDQPAARDRLARLQARYDQLREDQTAEGAQLTRLREEMQRVEAQRDSLEERNAELDEEDRERSTKP